MISNLLKRKLAADEIDENQAVFEQEIIERYNVSDVSNLKHYKSLKTLLTGIGDSWAQEKILTRVNFDPFANQSFEQEKLPLIAISSIETLNNIDTSYHLYNFDLKLAIHSETNSNSNLVIHIKKRILRVLFPCNPTSKQIFNVFENCSDTDGIQKLFMQLTGISNIKADCLEMSFKGTYQEIW